MSHQELDFSKLDASVIETFKGYFSLEVQIGETPPPEMYDQKLVAGLLSVTAGGEVEAQLVILFPEDSIFKILEKNYGVPMFEINEMVTDGVGEITNAVYCIFKEKLSKGPKKYDLALPNAKVFEGGLGDKAPSGEIPFKWYSTSIGNFFAGLAPVNHLT